jgi:hypothetical protein
VFMNGIMTEEKNNWGFNHDVLKTQS